jgi:Ca2+:H+ antiporter
MEIGSAYALQVCLLQIPAMVAFSAWYDPVNVGEVAKTFTYVLRLFRNPLVVLIET